MAASQSSLLFRQEALFLAGAAQISQLPKYSLPEVAFIGKSNVGKSSLINAVCNRRSLARVSHTPGRTQQINFFSLADKLILVDLPGYGFAKVPSHVKQRWNKLIPHYLESRYNLKLVNILIDARRNIKPHDLEILQLVNMYNKNFQIIFTKIDQISNVTELLESSSAILTNYGYSCNIIITSSRNGLGIKELQFCLDRARS